MGIANQRGSTLVWDRATGEPVGPGLGWQDLRTVGRCLELRAVGLTLGPNESATKLEALLDGADPDRRRDLCFGTVDSWVAWTLSGGRLHVMDATNAGITGLRTRGNDGWSDRALETLRIPPAMLPEVVDSSGVLGAAVALPGAPRSRVSSATSRRRCSARPAFTLATPRSRSGPAACSTSSSARPVPAFNRGPAGTFPIITRRVGADTWGLEAIMLAAGTNIEWLRDDLGLMADAAASHDVASGCADSGDVWFVPALLGLGTPDWDYGARGTLLGVTRGTTRAQVVRSVLEGVAHRGADLVDAAVADAGISIPTLRVDGGMTANPTFVQALADAAQRPVEVAPVREATALGAAFAAGLALGIWSGDDAIAATWAPAARVEPARTLDRERWRAARARARGWIPELSAIQL